MSGAYFGEFRVGFHTCSPFAVPEHWLRYRCIDYGLDMLACYWVAIDENGRSWVYRELYRKGLIVSDAAMAVRSHTLPGEAIQITFAPPDLWSRSRDSGKTSAEVFLQGGIPLVRADNNRVQGHLQIKELLSPMPDGRPGMVIFDTCKQLIDDIQAIQVDEKNPSDCAKQPHEVTHSVDSIRYYSVSRKLLTETAQAPEEPDEFAPLRYEELMTGGHADTSYVNY